MCPLIQSVIVEVMALCRCPLIVLCHLKHHLPSTNDTFLQLIPLLKEHRNELQSPLQQHLTTFSRLSGGGLILCIFVAL